jgi:hypothetical protein
MEPQVWRLYLPGFSIIFILRRKIPASHIDTFSLRSILLYASLPLCLGLPIDFLLVGLHYRIFKELQAPPILAICHTKPWKSNNKSPNSVNHVVVFILHYIIPRYSNSSSRVEELILAPVGIQINFSRFAK